MSWYIDAANSRVEMRRGIPVAIPKGSKIIIKIGLFRNPPSQLSTGQTFVITSFTDAVTFRYSIDTVNAGLIPLFKCDYPCSSCPSKS